jgi:hypothetical protein
MFVAEGYIAVAVKLHLYNVIVFAYNKTIQPFELPFDDFNVILQL